MLACLLVYALVSSVCEAARQESTGARQWAVLVAGSNGWFNYRHQANVAHAYHLLLDHGVPANQIITFAYDDIAHNEANPFPGKIFNDYSHKDYYQGLVIDYKGQEVTPQMFLRVLKGDAGLKNSGRKVLQSGPADRVFLFFSDHGAPGAFCFPDGQLLAAEVNAAITYLHEQRRYNELVVYHAVEESRSSLKNMQLQSRNALGVVSASGQESRNAVFCDDKTINTCLSDESAQRCLRDLRNRLQSSTGSQVQGDASGLQTVEVESRLQSSTGSQAQGDASGLQSVEVDSTVREAKDCVPTQRAHIHGMMQTLLRASSSQERSLASRRLMRSVKLSDLAEETMNLVVETANLKSSQRRLQSAQTTDTTNCVEAASQSFQRRCFSVQRVPEVAEQVNRLNALCRNGVTSSNIVAAIEDVCQ